MNEDTQVVVPGAFVDLFLTPQGHLRRRLSAPREVVSARHELCEDLAQMLTTTARDKLFELGVAQSDVLERIHSGLLAEGSPITPAEAGWVTGRLAELLEWPLPPNLAVTRKPGVVDDAATA